MMYATTYALTGKRSKKRTAKLLELFGQRGATPGTVAHYVFADGGGGLLIGTEEVMERLYEDAIHYSPWMELHTRPVLKIEDAVQISGAWASS
ncbi:MAG: DUF3303 family protein [Acidimicrobiia bacterium]